MPEIASYIIYAFAIALTVLELVMSYKDVKRWEKEPDKEHSLSLEHLREHMMLSYVLFAYLVSRAVFAKPELNLSDVFFSFFVIFVIGHFEDERKHKF